MGPGATTISRLIPRFCYLAANIICVVERGEHTSLLAQKGVYYDLYMRQFRQEEIGEAEARAPQARVWGFLSTDGFAETDKRMKVWHRPQ